MATMDENLLVNYSDYLKAVGSRALLTHKCRARCFLNWLSSNNIPPHRLTPHLVNEYLCHRKSRGRAAETLNGDLAGLRKFLRYARVEGLLSHDPTKGVSCRWLDIPGGYPAYQGVLHEVLSYKPYFLFSYRLPLFAPDWEKFLKHLRQEGYTQPSIWGIAGANRSFHDYLTSIAVRHIAQITRRHLESFLAYKQAEYEKRYRRPPSRQWMNSVRGPVTLFLDYAGRRRKLRFFKTRLAPKSLALSNRLLKCYLDFCRIHKGLKPSTLKHHRYALAKLNAFLKRRRIRRVQAASIADYDFFLVDCSKSLKTGALCGILSILRSLLRYLYLEGNLPHDLAQDLFPPCRFRDSLRPKYLPWDKVEQLLAGIDQSTVAGKRDYAALTLQAYHGLRAREVAKLVLSDIDWEIPALLLREQKNNTTSWVPLSAKAEDALKGYLAVRPPSPHQEVFLTVSAPLKPLNSSLWAIACRHILQRFGRISSLKHAHGVFRHSFAKMLLDHRATIPQIATLLRHKSLQSTQTYTRVDTEGLREVADNYSSWLAAPQAAASDTTAAEATR